MSLATPSITRPVEPSIRKKLWGGGAIGIAAYFFGYWRYQIGIGIEFSVLVREAAAQGQCLSGGAPPWNIAWLLSVLAIVGYGIFAWPRFGPWLTSLQLVVLGAVATGLIEHTELMLPYRHLPRMLRYAIEGGAVGGIVASVGLSKLFRGAPRVHLALRHVFAAMVFAGVLLAAMKAHHAKVHHDARAANPDWYDSFLPATWPDYCSEKPPNNREP